MRWRGASPLVYAAGMVRWPDLLGDRFKTRPPASPDSINRAQQELGVVFPADYRAFLLHCNGGEGSIGEHWVRMWPVHELKETNEGYGAREWYPGLLLIGTDGGGEAYVFDLRTSPWRVLEVPFIGYEPDQERVLGESFVDAIEFMRCVE
jgi:cell wall assembly regulator SMI1